MERPDLVQSANPESMLARLAEQKRTFDRQHGHGGGSESVREEIYRGHRIVVRTTYSVEVDGVPVEGHLGVTNDGQVHYHAVPNLGFSSAIDLVKKLIDAFPDDFPSEGDGDATGHQHGGSAHREG
jgi:hypothetical protein